MGLTIDQACTLD